MNTAQRAQGIADTIHASTNDKSISKEKLLALVEAELGHPQILDAPQSHGDIRSQAIAPDSILHIIAGNTPMAGIQSISRGLLLGSHNHVKLPSKELPELSAFIAALPAGLKCLVETKSNLPDEWLRNSQAVIVFGSDETIHHFRQKIHNKQTYIAHGHRISFSIIFENTDQELAQLAARDASLFDQQGCLSPHTFYVANQHDRSALDFAEQLAEEMENFNQKHPRSPLDAEANAQITSLRDSYDFRQVSDSSVKLWASQGSTDWTVIYEEDPLFAVSPLNRVVFVKPLPAIEHLPEQLFLVRPHLSSIAIHPFENQYINQIQHLGASRICRLGMAQEPSLFWHQDGQAQLSPLIKWIDVG